MNCIMKAIQRRAALGLQRLHWRQPYSHAVGCQWTFSALRSFSAINRGSPIPMSSLKSHSQSHKNMSLIRMTFPCERYQQHRYFTSEDTPKPVSRKQRSAAAAAAVAASANQNEQVQDGQSESSAGLSYDFGKEAHGQMFKIVDAINPITEENGFYFTQDEKCVQLHTNKGIYLFKIDWKLSRFIYRSPISGSQQYVYDPDSKLWVHFHDRHDMRGIIVRDLLRHSSGVANFRN